MYSIQSASKAIAAQDWQLAEKQLRLLYGKKKYVPEVPYNLALVVRLKGRPKEALKILTKTVRQFPDYQQASFELANTFVELGSVKEAHIQLKQHISKWTDDIDALKLIVRLEINQGNLEFAQQHLEKVQALLPSTEIEVEYLSAVLNLRFGKWEEARRQIQNLANLDPSMRPLLLQEVTHSQRGSIPLNPDRLGWE